MPVTGFVIRVPCLKRSGPADLHQGVLVTFSSFPCCSHYPGMS